MTNISRVPRKGAHTLGRLRCWALALVTFTAGCELAVVTTPAGADLLIVEAVLRAGEPRQEVLLHRTLAGRVVRGERDARVALRTSEGREVVLEQTPLSQCTGAMPAQDSLSVEIEATCYSTRTGEMRVRPGQRYELWVQSSAGEVVRGQTQVPGHFDLRAPNLPRGAVGCSLPPGTSLPVTWSSSPGAWGYLAGMRIAGLQSALRGTGIDAPDLIELTGVAVSERDTTIVVPAELGVFERFGSDQELLRALQNGFPAGVTVDLVIAAMDRNFVNGVRGGNFNPSGNVRISSVVGDGAGVFGSLVPRRLFIRVGRSPGELPPCIAS